MYRERPNLKESVDLAAAEATGKNAPACLPEADNSWAGKSADSRHQPAAYDTGAASGDSVTQSRPVLDWLGKRLAITSIALATFFSYFTVHFLTGHYFWRLTDIQSTEYMNSTTDASSAGVLIAFICTARFFRAFAGLKDNPPIKIFRGLLIALLFFMGFAHGQPGLLVAAGASLVYLAMGVLGRQIRQAIPPTFRFGRAVICAGLASAPTAMLTVWVFYAAFTTDRSSAYQYTYTDHTGNEWGALMLFLTFLIALPTYVIARNARTSEKKPLIALGLLQQSPLLIGLLFQAAISSGGANGAPMLLASTAAILSTVAIAALGASAGATVNGIRHRRKMQLSGEHVF